MPQIFDNIEKHLLDGLKDAMGVAERSDFCVGYFNLRGWRQIDSLVERWTGGDGHCCRLLVGMQQAPQEQLRAELGFTKGGLEIDQATAIKRKRKLVEDFRDQLTHGIPTDTDEAGLRRLATQIKAKKLIVKLFLRHQLHAKLYLLFRQDPLNPAIGYLGSSNLTLAGLSSQGELNVDILDRDACDKLANWFENRWIDRFCIDISQELVDIIDNSWARPDPIPPYHIYVKMAYHLSQEARDGLAEFHIPNDFGNKLFDFQKAAVKIAAHHLNKRGGVVIGDVVGLGKTLMATALARIFEDDYGVETLIICPKNLVRMWEDYRQQYRLRAKVLSVTQVQNELLQLRRFRLVLINESHNLRNSEGRRYRAIADYIASNDSRVILLSATPYNKTYLDLSNQLRLFIDETKNIGIRPEKLLREIGETEFIRRHQCPVRSLAAFEKSDDADDWRDLMRLYLVRRTRSFIQDNYAKLDEAQNRKYLEFSDGTRSYFPVRMPKTVKFAFSEKDPSDQYARLFSDEVVKTVNGLRLPRYGLGNYQTPSPIKPPTPDEAKTLGDLSRAGIRLKGFCRTNLFKRLESSGYAFILSVERHILRNFIYLYAIEKGLSVPIGPQDIGLLDTSANDRDTDLLGAAAEGNGNGEADPTTTIRNVTTEKEFQERASEVYELYATERDPKLAKIIQEMPNVVYSTRPHKPTPNQPEGALVYLRTAEGGEALAWINDEGKSVTESQFAILKAAECVPETPALPRHKNHHDLVAKGVKLIVETEKSVGGQLGRPTGARFRTYDCLKRYAEEIRGSLLDKPDLHKAIDDIYKYPLLQSATDTLNRQLKSGIDDIGLVDLVMSLRADARLCRISEDAESTEPQLICSLGLRKPE